jgi:hypothetical protein
VLYLFREIDVRNIDIDRHRTYIIERILENGDDKVITWLARTYPKDAIIETVESSAIITGPTANLWALVFNIPQERIKCFQAQSMPKAGKY